MGRGLWQLITYYRNRHELWTLRTSRKLPSFFRPVPVLALVMPWYILSSVPLLSVFFLLRALGVSEGVLIAITTIPSLAWLFVVTPWFFQWYWIGLTLHFGGFKAADAKEKNLMAWLEVSRKKIGD